MLFVWVIKLKRHTNSESVRRSDDLCAQRHEPIGTKAICNSIPENDDQISHHVYDRNACERAS